MKINFKVLFIIGVFLLSITTVCAIYKYQADEVSYTPNDTNFNVNNVKEALDLLYSKNPNYGFQFVSNKNMFVDTVGETKITSHGLEPLSYETSTSWQYSTTSREYTIDIKNDFEISMNVFIDNTNSSSMGGIVLRFYKEDDKVLEMLLQDAWELNNNVIQYFEINGNVILNRTIGATNLSGRYGIVGIDNTIKVYYGNQMINSMTLPTDLSCDRVEITFQKFYNHNTPNTYIESLYVGKPLFYKD